MLEEMELDLVIRKVKDCNPIGGLYTKIGTSDFAQIVQIGCQSDTRLVDRYI